MTYDIIKKIDEIYSHQYFTDKNFHEFTKLIQKKDVINAFTDFFEIIYNLYIELNPDIDINIDISRNNIRLFLSSYVLTYYPSIMNIKQSMNICKTLIDISKLIHILIKKIIVNYKTNNYVHINTNDSIITFFFSKYTKYLTVFEEWKAIDKKGIFFNLAITIFEMEQEYNDIEKDSTNQELLNITKEQMNAEIKLMYTRAESIDKENGKIYTQNYYNYITQDHNIASNNITKDEQSIYFAKLEKTIEKTIHTAYWDILENDLTQIPPKLDNLTTHLQELIFLISSCIPNRPDIHSEVQENIDVEFIKHKILTNTFDYEELKKYSNYIIDTLRKLQSKSEDNITDNFQTYIQNLINNNIPIPFIIKKILAFSFKKFEHIYIQKNEFLNSINK